MNAKIKRILKKKNKTKIICLTSYSKNISEILDKYTDIILVGDSLGSVLYSFDTTKKVNLNMIIEHSKSVRLGVKKSLMVVDMPYNTYRNKSEAIRASVRCFEEGADLLMVKPGQGSIDLIETIKNKTGLMVGAYQVSGEYAGIALAAEKNLLNLNDALLESWHVMKRAGAQFIISYGARKSKELGIRE